MKSNLRQLGRVSFPEFTGERAYMVPFIKTLPAHLARWQPTVDQMLDGLDVPGTCFFMLDQGVVEAGGTHRRGGLHVDGNWLAELRCHGEQPPYSPPGHGHQPPPQRPHHAHAGSWDHPNPTPGFKHRWHYQPEAIVLAADVLGCVGYVGEFDGIIGSGGECEADVSRMPRVEFEPGISWAGNVTMLHEAIPLAERTARTVIRINVPGSLTC